jgi:hypothetical protein
MMLRYYSMKQDSMKTRSTAVSRQDKYARGLETASGSCMYCVPSRHGELATRYEFAKAPSFWKELGRYISSRRWATLRKRFLSEASLQ